jgi:hypothetical protein
MTTPLSIKSICDQRRQQMLRNVPPSRINIISPYDTTNYTKFDLDMRRKAEVLKYQKGSTKGNTLTKKQQWGQIVNGYYRNLSSSALNRITRLDTNAVKIVDCSSGLILTPLSASNVPSDPNVPFLYNDNRVPLYNYLNPISTRAYGFVDLETNPDIIFKTNIYNNISCTSNISNKIASILFTNNANQDAYTLSIQNIPLAICIQGDLSGGIVNDIILNDAYINSIEINAYYNGNLVPDRSLYQYTYSPNTVLQNYNLTISTNIPQNGSTFKGTQYIGTLSVSNILLYASPGFIYDFELLVNLSYIVSKSPDIISMNTSVIANVTSDQISLYGCSIQPVLNSSNIPTMSIS